MIWESSYWKDELTSLIDELDSAIRKYNEFDDPEEAEVLDAIRFRVERALFFSALAVRCLVESNKVTDMRANSVVHVIEYRTVPGSKTETVLGDEWKYDFDTRWNVTLSAKSLFDEILHSHDLRFEEGDGGDITDFLIASEKNRSRRLLSVELPKLRSCIRSFALEDVRRIRREVLPDGFARKYAASALLPGPCA